MKKLITGLSFALAAGSSTWAMAESYVIDTQGAHASIEFRISHLGFSWLTGRFEDFTGSFEWDADQPEASSVEVHIETASIDSNHAERDKHLRSKDFLNVNQYPDATFKSTGYETTGEGQGTLSGELTLMGVTREISFPVELIGEGVDPWGGYRAGFTGSTSLALKDYGIDYDLGPASTHVEMTLHIEGIRN